jgi:hypothetical protein
MGAEFLTINIKEDGEGYFLFFIRPNFIKKFDYPILIIFIY